MQHKNNPYLPDYSVKIRIRPSRVHIIIYNQFFIRPSLTRNIRYKASEPHIFFRINSLTDIKIKCYLCLMNKKEKIDKTWSFTKRLWRHKYFWVITIFVVVVGFLDPNSYWRRYELNKQRSELKEEIKKYQDAYQKEQTQINMLKNNPQNITKMARERYLMKRANEDVYLIEDENNE